MMIWWIRWFPSLLSSSVLHLLQMDGIGSWFDFLVMIIVEEDGLQLRTMIMERYTRRHRVTHHPRRAAGTVRLKSSTKSDLIITSLLALSFLVEAFWQLFNLDVEILFVYYRANSERPYRQLAAISLQDEKMYWKHDNFGYIQLFSFHNRIYLERVIEHPESAQPLSYPSIAQSH